MSTYHANLTQVATVLHVVATAGVPAWISSGCVIVGALSAVKSTVLDTGDVDSRNIVG